MWRQHEPRLPFVLGLCWGFWGSGTSSVISLEQRPSLPSLRTNGYMGQAGPGTSLAVP